MSYPVHNNKIPITVLRTASYTTKITGFALTALTVPLAGVKLLTNSTNDSFWNGWRALGLLTLGAVASFGASSYLSSKQAQTTVTQSLIKPEVEATHTKHTSTEINSIPREILQKIISNNELREILTRVNEKEGFSLEDITALSSYGVKLERTLGDESYYLEGLHEDSEQTFCQLFKEENGKEKIASLRIRLKDLISELEAGGINGVFVQPLTKDLGTSDENFKPSGESIRIFVNELLVA